MAQSLWFSSSCDASSQNTTHSWRVVFLDFGKGFLENNISHNILIFPLVLFVLYPKYRAFGKLRPFNLCHKKVDDACILPIICVSSLTNLKGDEYCFE